MDEITNNNKYLLPPKTSNLKTLVLDLDETLVHSQFIEFSSPSDIIIKIEIENEIYDIHVLVRPGVKEFLEKMKNFYEIVIFTASISKYADILLNIIDQNGCAPYRLFREHCTFINNIFVKDLQKLGRDLKDIIILDNSPLSYSFHPNNGLPILSWFEDKKDKELYNITPILIFLSNVKDVRDFIPKFVINNSISYSEAEKLFKKYGFNQEKGNNMNYGFIKKLTKIKSDDNINTNKDINNNNINNLREKQNNNNNLNSKEYNINIQIVQNNINNYNNIINEKQTNDIKNKLIKYLNTGNSDTKNVNEKKQITEKILKLKQKNIIASVDNPCNEKKIIERKDKNKCHKRHNTININNSPKFTQNDKEKDKDKEKKYNKINTKNKNNIKNVKHTTQKSNIEINNKNINKSMNPVNNIIMSKKRKRGDTPIGKINTIVFSQNNNNIDNMNNKGNIISIQKKSKKSNSNNEKRNNSNNSNKRTKFLLPIETNDFSLFKRLCTLTTKPRKSNNNKKRRNLNQLNLMQKNRIKSKSNQRFYLNKEDNNVMSYSINFNNFNLNNNIYKTFKIGENFMKPSHKKQNSYNENNFLKIRNNLIKSHELKTKRLINKNDFLKNEIKKVNNINQINTISNINIYKNKLIKRTYGNFKKINLKNIEFITKRDKKIVQLDIKTKNIDNNNNDLNKLKLNENIFNLYQTFNRNDKNEENNTVFNNTSDKFINDKNTYRRICHQKTISYNFNSTRNINNLLSSKNKMNKKYRRIYNSRIKSKRRQSKNDFTDYRRDKHNKKEDNIIYIKNMFKNKIFDFIYYTKDNIKDINKISSKSRGVKNVNKNLKNKNNVK